MTPDWSSLDLLSFVFFGLMLLTFGAFIADHRPRTSPLDETERERRR